VVDRDTRSALTFLFTDIEGSTRLWQDAPGAMSMAVAKHEELIAACVARCEGELVKAGSRGDAALAVFQEAGSAVSCAVDVQRAFAAEEWPEGAVLRVRCAVHTGEAEKRAGDYFGTTLNRAARLLATAHGRQAIVSWATANEADGTLPDDVELIDLGQHFLKDLYEPERVFQIRAPGLTRAFPPLASATPRTHNLPAHLTSFVGRGDELRELDQLIAGSRLVTIAGVGGAGKTRLAVQAAAEHVDRFQDGVRFVDLAPVRDPLTVPRTFVLALEAIDPAVDAAIDDARAAADAWTEHLVRVLKDRKVLIVVDNCEHVVDATARVVSALLRACGQLRVLATSREPIEVDGEHLYRVPPLTPPAGDLEDVNALMDVASVRLFCDRARAVRADFRLSERNAAGVADICRRLDGIPLALELAAARTRSLSPAQIAERLAGSPDLLSATGRDVNERHRTLEAALEWSYEALDDDERALLRRLATFNGGWSLEAAEAVCGVAPLTAGVVLDLLAQLVDRSLVVVDDQGLDVRYRLLEPVRQFADRKLSLADEADSARDLHRDWFVRQVGDESFSLYTSEGRLAELTPELDNFRAALRWSIDTGDATSAMQMAGPLNSAFVWIGQRTEADAWLTESLAIADPGVADLTASTIGTLAANLDLSGDVRRAVELQRQAGAMFAELGNRSSLLWSLVYLAHSLHFRGEYEEEDEVYARALTLAVETGDKIAMSLIPFLQTWLRVTNARVSEAREKCRVSYEVGDDGHAGVRVGLPAYVALCDFLEGDHDATSRCDGPIATLLSEFVDAAGNEDPMGLWFLHLVGCLETTQQATRERGRARLADLIPRARRTGLLGAFPNPLDSLAASIALDDGRPAESALVFGAVDRLRSDTGIEMRYAATQPMVDAGRETARKELGAVAFEREIDRGRRLSLPEALDLTADLLVRRR
jgi:predicted ATPase/class 3 adenylate cyclase